MRYQFWHDFRQRADHSPVLYGLNETRPSQDKDDEQEVFITALAQISRWLCTTHPDAAGGEYVMFTMKVWEPACRSLILTVYGTCMPMLNLTRRGVRY